MTQPQLIIEYILEHGSIVPAKVGGSPYKDGFFGSETSKRCRELRKQGRLTSVKEGRFEKFFLIEQDEEWDKIKENEYSVVEEKEFDFSNTDCCNGCHQGGVSEHGCENIRCDCHIKYPTLPL